MHDVQRASAAGVYYSNFVPSSFEYLALADRGLADYNRPGPAGRLQMT